MVSEGDRPDVHGITAIVFTHNLRSADRSISASEFINDGILASCHDRTGSKDTE
jgi:hypothetical protein